MDHPALESRFTQSDWAEWRPSSVTVFSSLIPDACWGLTLELPSNPLLSLFLENGASFSPAKSVLQASLNLFDPSLSACKPEGHYQSSYSSQTKRLNFFGQKTKAHSCILQYDNLPSAVINRAVPDSAHCFAQHSSIFRPRSADGLLSH